VKFHEAVDVLVNVYTFNTNGVAHQAGVGPLEECGPMGLHADVRTGIDKTDKCGKGSHKDDDGR
jgi:hypothetical protein